MRAVIADVDALEDAPGEPVLTALEHGQPARALVPLAVLELVDLVAGLGAEQLREVLRALRHEVHGEQLGALRHAERVVLVGEARDEPRGVYGALRREPDEAAGAL